MALTLPYDRRFCFRALSIWASSLSWPASLSPDGVGVSFAELAMSFALSTGSPLPIWTRGVGWALQASSPDGFVLAAVAAVMRTCWKLIVQHRVVRGEIWVTRVQSLASFGFETNSGQASGLPVRPALQERVAVASAFRRAFHTGSRRSMLRRLEIMRARRVFRRTWRGAYSPSSLCRLVCV